MIHPINFSSGIAVLKRPSIITTNSRITRLISYVLKRLRQHRSLRMEAKRLYTENKTTDKESDKVTKKYFHIVHKSLKNCAKVHKKDEKEHLTIELFTFR